MTTGYMELCWSVDRLAVSNLITHNKLKILQVTIHETPQILRLSFLYLENWCLDFRAGLGLPYVQKHGIDVESLFGVSLSPVVFRNDVVLDQRNRRPNGGTTACVFTCEAGGVGAGIGERGGSAGVG